MQSDQSRMPEILHYPAGTFGKCYRALSCKVKTVTSEEKIKIGSLYKVTGYDNPMFALAIIGYAKSQRYASPLFILSFLNI